MILIGIDFSLNSPSICIMEDGKISKIISVTRDTHDKEWFLKKKKNPYPHLEECPEVKLVFLDKPKIPSEYIEKERNKLIIFEDLANAIVDSIFKELPNFPPTEIFVAIEGIAFGATGNSLIDISMATHSLRSKILAQLCSWTPDKFFVFSPGTVKGSTGYKERRADLKESNEKYNVKGLAKKWEMYDCLTNSELAYLSDSAYVKLLRENEIEWITPSLNVKKPLDDINDSIWVCETLRRHLDN